MMCGKVGIKNIAMPYLLALPAFVLVSVFALGTLNGIAQGLGIMPFLGMTTPTLDYIRQTLERPDFASSFLFSCKVSLISAFIALLGGVLLSAALVKTRSRAAVRLVALQLPIMTMHALVALALIFLFSGSGLVARILVALGVVSSPQDIPSVVGAASGWGIIAVYAWKEIPYVAFMTYAIMQHVSTGLAEAARSCGASPLQTFWQITLPLCLPAAIRAFIVVLVFAFGAYEVPFLLGPTLPKTLPVLAYIEFQNPEIAHRVYAMAINSIITLICLALAALYVYALSIERRRSEEGPHA